MPTEPIFAVSLLKEWYEENCGKLAELGAVCKYQEAVGTAEQPGKANVSIESPILAATITAWDSASCLDIGVLDVSTNQDSWPVEGECRDMREFSEKLEAFREWFLAKHKAAGA